MWKMTTRNSTGSGFYSHPPAAKPIIIIIIIIHHCGNYVLSKHTSWIMWWKLSGYECCGLCLHKSYISCLEDYYFLNQKKQKMLIYVYELLCSFHDNKTSLLACSVVNTHHCIQMWQCSVYFYYIWRDLS